MAQNETMVYQVWIQVWSKAPICGTDILRPHPTEKSKLEQSCHCLKDTSHTACSGWYSNPVPRVLKSAPLPLSYRGSLHTEEVASWQIGEDMLRNATLLFRLWLTKIYFSSTDQRANTYVMKRPVIRRRRCPLTVCLWRSNIGRFSRKLVRRNFSTRLQLRSKVAKSSHIK